MDVVRLSLLLTLGRHFHICSFSVPPEKSKNLCFYDVLSSYRKGTLGQNGLI